MRKFIGFRLQVLVIFLLLLSTVTCTLLGFFHLSTVYAAAPQDVPNNKVGVHIISATADEVDRAATMVNSTGGDWGYITITIQDGDRDKDKWQSFFDELRKKHLIPLLRLATHPEGSSWQVPGSNEANLWADFLNQLNWPTRNRYIIVYNEPNQGQEWGGSVNPAQYAQVLDQTINAFKSKSSDFFIINAGFDQLAPQNPPGYEDEERFLKDMNSSIPGVFNKLDGWASHSYPNPGYVGSPDGTGRGSVRGYQWEMSLLQGLGLNKNLPIFITETGWKHAEGMVYDKSLPSSTEVGQDLQEAFKGAWSDSNVVAVTPFLLDYQSAPFDHFSFRKLESDISNLKVLGTQTPDPQDFYSQYSSMVLLTKTAGLPEQTQQGSLVSSGIPSSLVTGQSYSFPITFQNTGESIWGERGEIKLVVLQGASQFQATIQPLNPSTKVEPGQKQTFQVNLVAPGEGSYNFALGLFNGSKQVQVDNLTYPVAVKSPVILIIKSSLRWKNNFSGNYILSIASSIGESMKTVVLGNKGVSDQIEERDLLPDYSFDFTLKKPYYQSKTIHQAVHSGVNTLDFGELQPDIASALLDPPELWKLMPWSN